jgi:hypothetical protein
LPIANDNGADRNQAATDSRADDSAKLAAVDLITQVDWSIDAVALALGRTAQWVQDALDHYVEDGVLN